MQIMETVSTMQTIETRQTIETTCRIPISHALNENKEYMFNIHGACDEMYNFRFILESDSKEANELFRNIRKVCLFSHGIMLDGYSPTKWDNRVVEHEIPLRFWISKRETPMNNLSFAYGWRWISVYTPYIEGLVLCFDRILHDHQSLCDHKIETHHEHHIDTIHKFNSVRHYYGNIRSEHIQQIGLHSNIPIRECIRHVRLYSDSDNYESIINVECDDAATVFWLDYERGHNDLVIELSRFSDVCKISLLYKYQMMALQYDGSVILAHQD